MDQHLALNLLQAVTDKNIDGGGVGMLLVRSLIPTHLGLSLATLMAIPCRPYSLRLTGALLQLVLECINRTLVSPTKGL